jgi:hypothetical protein
MNLPGYINIRHAGHEIVLREAGLNFDAFLSDKLWKQYNADKNKREEGTRIWDVLFMPRTGSSGPAAVKERPRPFRVRLPTLEGSEVTLVAHIPKHVLAFCVSLASELPEVDSGVQR